MNGDSSSVQVHLNKGNTEAEVKIVDTGSGISEATLEKLGQPDYSTKSQGTGLGLTLAYKVIHELGGKISVQSEVGLGTTFRITLPLVERVFFKRPSNLSKQRWVTSAFLGTE